MVRLERATGPLRRAARPPLMVRLWRTIWFPVLAVPKLGGKLPPRTGRWPVPPGIQGIIPTTASAA